MGRLPNSPSLSFAFPTSKPAPSENAADVERRVKAPGIDIQVILAGSTLSLPGNEFHGIALKDEPTPPPHAVFVPGEAAGHELIPKNLQYGRNACLNHPPPSFPIRTAVADPLIGQELENRS